MTEKCKNCGEDIIHNGNPEMPYDHRLPSRCKYPQPKESDEWWNYQIDK